MENCESPDDGVAGFTEDKVDIVPVFSAVTQEVAAALPLWVTPDVVPFTTTVTVNHPMQKDIALGLLDSYDDIGEMRGRNVKVNIQGVSFTAQISQNVIDAVSVGVALSSVMGGALQKAIHDYSMIVNGDVIDAAYEGATLNIRYVGEAKKPILVSAFSELSPAPDVWSTELDAAGVQTLLAPAAGCCGALKFHLNDQAGAMVQMRANIDAWWPYLDGDDAVEAIVMNASGCGVTVKEYGHILRDDPAYAQRASRVSALTRDLSELLPDLVSPLAGKLDAARVRNAAGKEASETIAFHPPCTLQHGQQLRGVVEQHLGALGFKLRVAVNESHLCCGSAGTYSVLNPDIAQQLRDRKLEKLAELAPALIVSANIGCISHLQSGTATPVRHWVELLDQALIAQPR